MIPLKPLFLKYLDGEISPEEYQKLFKKDFIQRSLVINGVNVIAMYIVFFYSSTHGGLEKGAAFSPQVTTLLTIGIYFAIALIYEYFSYRGKMKEMRFFIAVKKEHELMFKSVHFSAENEKTTVPVKAQKLYTEGKISKLKYVRTVFNFQTIVGPVFFPLVFIPLVLLCSFGVDDIGVRVGASYLIAFFGAFLVIHKAIPWAKILLRQTLIQKDQATAIFESAQNK